jgi:hypothetical protein
VSIEAASEVFDWLLKHLDITHNPRFEASSDRLMAAWDKPLVTLRAFQMLSVNVRSLCGRDAVTSAASQSRQDGKHY